jgi:PIN domain nuclease of toxin-antitoxin system
MPLDTHCLLWWWSAESELSDAVRSLSENPVNTIIVSAASAWEISAKTRISHILLGIRKIATDTALRFVIYRHEA